MAFYHPIQLSKKNKKRASAPPEHMKPNRLTLRHQTNLSRKDNLSIICQAV